MQVNNWCRQIDHSSVNNMACLWQIENSIVKEKYIFKICLRLNRFWETDVLKLLEAFQNSVKRLMRSSFPVRRFWRKTKCLCRKLFLVTFWVEGNKWNLKCICGGVYFVWENSFKLDIFLSASRQFWVVSFYIWQPASRYGKLHLTPFLGLNSVTFLA